MDSLTQIVLGASVGEAVLGKKVGNKALLWGAIAGTIPDLDVIAKFFTDDVTANELHRGFSHSILFSLLIAPLLGFLVEKIYKTKEANWKQWSILFFWSLFTHPLLDAFTTWGTQLFWPFDHKIAIKSIFVIDPLYTLPFLICTLSVLFFKRNHPKRSTINKIGIILSSSYLLLTLLFKSVATKTIEQSLIDQNIEFVELQTRPTPFNTMLWAANIETPDTYLIGYYSFFDTNKEIQFYSFPKNRESHQEILNTEIAQRLVQLTEGWYLIEKQNDHYYFNDLRFGQLGIEEKSDRFVFSYEIFQNESLQWTAKEREPETEAAKPLLKKLWNRIWGEKVSSKSK